MCVCGVVCGRYVTFIDLFMHIPESFIKHFLISALHADADCRAHVRLIICSSHDFQVPTEHSCLSLSTQCSMAFPAQFSEYGLNLPRKQHGHGYHSSPALGYQFLHYYVFSVVVIDTRTKSNQWRKDCFILPIQGTTLHH